MSERSSIPALSPVAGWWLARAVLVLGFALVVKSYWSPYYGFTMLLEADTVTAASLPASLRDAPLYIHPGVGRYDGAYYAQIATSPGLRDPALADAVDDVGYRARRILLSAITLRRAPHTTHSPSRRRGGSSDIDSVQR